MIRTEQQAREDLQQYFLQFHTIVRQAVVDFSANYGPLRADQSKRTEASIIHDLMTKHSRMQFGDDRGVKLSLENNLFLMHVGGKYSIKPKKLTNGRPANNVTQLVIDFREQAVQRTLPGVEQPPTNLYLGYERADDSVELTDLPVWLICPRGQRIEWAICLDDEVSTLTRPAAITDVRARVPGEEKMARARIRSLKENVEDETEDHRRG